jgi:hypothetical protein
MLRKVHSVAYTYCEECLVKVCVLRHRIHHSQSRFCLIRYVDCNKARCPVCYVMHKHIPRGEFCATGRGNGRKELLFLKKGVHIQKRDPI